MTGNVHTEEIHEIILNISGDLSPFHTFPAPEAALLRACDDIGICGAPVPMFLPGIFLDPTG